MISIDTVTPANISTNTNQSDIFNVSNSKVIIGIVIFATIGYLIYINSINKNHSLVTTKLEPTTTNRTFTSQSAILLRLVDHHPQLDRIIEIFFNVDRVHRDDTYGPQLLLSLNEGSRFRPILDNFSISSVGDASLLVDVLHISPLDAQTVLLFLQVCRVDSTQVSCFERDFFAVGHAHWLI